MMSCLFRFPSPAVVLGLRRLLTASLLLLPALLLCLPSASAASPPEIAAALAWYDSIGYPDTTNLPLVRVSTGSFSKPENGPAQASYIEGFLLSQQGDSFTVFICSVPHAAPFDFFVHSYPPLSAISFVRHTSSEPAASVGFEVLDFDQAAVTALAQAQASAKKYRGLRPSFYGADRAQVFIFARACLQKGQTAIADQLFAMALSARAQVQPDELPFLTSSLQREIGDAVFKEVERRFGDPSFTWAEALQRFDGFEEHFPASPRIAEARETADILGKMVAEETAHHPKPLDQMTVDERVAENIYQLRNLGDVDWIMYQPYPALALSRTGEKIITPVHRLVDLGSAAVPQLIEALDDRRFTHCMEQSFHAQIPPRVLRVSDIAQRILEHISGRNFYAGPSEEGAAPNPSSRRQAETWWAEVQRKGEKQILVEKCSAGGEAGRSAARLLVAKFPDAALDPIRAGWNSTSVEAYRGEYVEIAAGLPGDAALPFLKEMLGPEKDVYSRTRAADALLKQGLTDGLGPMVEAWSRIRIRLDETDEGYQQCGQIIASLAKTGAAQAIDALGTDLKKLPVDVRLAVVKAFLPYPRRSGLSGSGISVSVDVDTVKLADDGASRSLERMLIAALDDREHRFGQSGNYNESSYTDPRVCDFAALTLVQRWPQKYQFRWAPTDAANDSQILVLRNKWRVEQDLPALPPPAVAAIAPASQAEVAPLLDQYLGAKDPGEASLVRDRLVQKFGLAALPVVRARAEKSDDPKLKSLLTDLAAIVREVHVLKDANDAAAQSGIEALRGERLDGKHLTGLLLHLQTALPEHVKGLTLVLQRAGDDQGFELTISWAAGEAAGADGWQRALAVRNGTTNLHTDTGWSADQGGVPKETLYKKIGGAFDKAIQAGPSEPVIARAQIVHSNASR